VNKAVFFGEIQLNIIDKSENPGSKFGVDIIILGLNNSNTFEGIQDGKYPLTGIIPGTAVAQWLNRVFTIRA
jgi:hypothetical protein